MSKTINALLSPVTNTFFYWLLIGFNIIDYVLTKLILEGGGSELNPLVLWFINMYGPIGIIIVKAPPLILLGVMLFKYWDRLDDTWKRVFRHGLITLNLVFGLLILYSSIGLYAVS